MRQLLLLDVLRARQSLPLDFRMGEAGDVTQLSHLTAAGGESVGNAFLSGAENLFDADSTKSVLITPHYNYAAPSSTTKKAELTDIINEELEAIYTGQKTVEEGLESAKTRGDAALAG